jgi:hypothetical protein
MFIFGVIIIKHKIMKTKILVLLGLLLFAVSVPAMAIIQDDGGGFEASQLITLLNPAIVFFAVQLAKKVTLINSTVILAILVPGISLLGSWLISLVVPDTSFFITFLIGLGSTFVYELQKQLSSST